MKENNAEQLSAFYLEIFSPNKRWLYALKVMYRSVHKNTPTGHPD